MSSIARLSLSKGVDQNAQVAGWDETIGDNNNNNNNNNNHKAWQEQRASMASHVLAHKTLVCGTLNTAATATATAAAAAADPENWITWTRSFAPHRVCRVTCNDSGTVVAATMDNGTVSILRGIDGTVLATRRIASEGVRIPAEVSFVTSGSQQQLLLDTLVIEPPEDEPIILVSHIDGARLNSDDKGVVEDAAKSMVIHALNEIADVRTLRGCWKDDTTVRFALVDGDGKLAIYDYNLNDKTGIVLRQGISTDSDQDWEIDYTAGLRVQQVGDKHRFLLFSACSGNDTKICWFDLNTLTMSLSHYMISQGSYTRTRLLALEPVASCTNDSSLAIVVASLTPATDDSKPKLDSKIMQAHVRDDGTIGQLHPVYHIPVPATVKSMAIAPICGIPYAFRCLTAHNQDSRECHNFSTNTTTGSTIGSIRLLAMTNQFDQANTLVKQTGEEELIADPFAGFHPSEIALRQLQILLSKGRVNDPTSVLQSRECLKQLSVGAMSGNVPGHTALLSAAESILQWPDEASMLNPPTLGEVVMGLSGIISILSGVSSKVPQSMASESKVKLHELEEKLYPMKYLESILNKDIPLNATFASVRSVKDLFACLIRANYFLAAEQMWRSPLQPKLTSEVMVTSVLNISSKVNPRHYASLLREIVVPSLSINHELLPPLLAWSCRTSDDFDDARDNKNSLDDAIFLLEILERATKDLRLKIHSSFASHAPFVEKIGTKKRRISQQKDTSVMSSSIDISFTSVASSHPVQVQEETTTEAPPTDDIERPNPTILELGRIKGGAQKSRSRKFASLEAVDESEESVESKLVAARCLKHARGLGLDRNLVSLRTFSSYGGTQFIAKELVRLFSSSSKTHDKRSQKLSTCFRNFCQESSARFDEAIILYAKELCGGKNTSKRAIEESSSLSRCCIATITKCQVVLITLRAALFCRFSPLWLSKLSQEAIEWAAGDSSLRSELEEASRLLLIDGIVGRYCGDGAKELFHVDNPRHAIRLVEFMSRHLTQESILSDTLDLCEAFTHLSREEACNRIIQNAILQGNEAACSSLLESLYSRNVLLAKTTFARVISFCVDMIEEGPGHLDSPLQKEQVIFATSCAHQLSQTALAHIHSHVRGHTGGYSSGHYDEARLEGLMEDFMHLKVLQNSHGVFLSVADLHDPKMLVETATKFLVPLVDSYAEGTSTASSTIATKTKRVCSLLAGSSRIPDRQLWFAAIGASACRLAWATSDVQCLEFLSDLGVLDSLDDGLSARCCLAVALTLCKKALKQSNSHDILTCMKYVIMATSLLKDTSIPRCPVDLLGAAVTVEELCDIISQILVRADEGIGEEVDEFRKLLHSSAESKVWSSALATKDIQKDGKDSLLMHRPSLHPSWYVGDGLLLPPSETLIYGLDFCKQSLARCSLADVTFELFSFVEGRGAHALALRVLTYSTMTQMCQSGNDISHFQAILDTHNQTLTALAERSLGGSGNGILSGVVDSQLAGSFLLCLPLKRAFKVYKSSLPTAMSTRDFERLGKLANIGKAVGSGDVLLPASNPKLLRNWKRQEKFVSQCHQLASRANWWSTLQMYNVKFDMYRFEEGRQDPSKDEKSNPPKYPSTLLPSLISNMSESDVETSKILQTAIDFSLAFGLGKETAIYRYLEYLLSPVSGESKTTENDIRLKLSSLETLARDLICRLESPRKRINVLRKCLISLEMSSDCRDYERLEILSALYQMELSSFLRVISEDDTNLQPFLLDLELVDRRRDALAILSSYFQAEKKGDRPPFASFFSPFPKSLESDGSAIPTRTTVGILGSECEKARDSFDPLRPLDGILSTSCNSAATSALHPLCLPVGVPRGYIHTRSLIARFKKSKLEKVALPSFEDDVVPVLNRLKSPADVADLAEWCATQYSFENEDKLRSLDNALNSAMQASSEAERRTRQNSEKYEYESSALERVKRISNARDVLVDRLAINAILASVGITSEKFCALSSLVDDLMQRLEEQVWSKAEFVPEKFVEIFLTEASFLAAEACLCDQKALSIGKFQQLCILVHQACKSVAERYSHVQIGDTARRLARRWLFHGDQVTSNEDSQATNDGSMNNSRVYHDAMARFLPDIEEEDTVNFVMDLTSLAKSENVWSADIGAGQAAKQGQKKFTSEEEPCSLKFPGCCNERSDISSRRASLRIAFVMAYADGYHGDNTGHQGAKENLKLATNRPTETRSSKQKSRGGLLAKIGYSESRKQHESVIEHSRELLRIVFAKSGSSDWVERYQYTSNASKITSGSADAQKTITFAMRHRALRAASILCPQEALEEVISEESFLKTSTTSSLKKCSFGAYVAKEIEELGLPLPHSDLSQLSTINFPSYARTLWRHHRDSKVSKGRLLLLIIEMYLKEQISDYNFFLSILAEVEKSNLPRTLLLALESIGRYKERIGVEKVGSFFSNAGENILSSMKGLSEIIHTEFKGVLDSPNPSRHQIQDAVATSKRLGRLAKSFCRGYQGQVNLEQFIKSQLQIVGLLSRKADKEGLLTVVHALLQHFEDIETSQRLAQAFSKVDADSFASSPYFESLKSENAGIDDPMCNSLNKLEASLNSLSKAS